jgi:mRNA interferase RelE/StbE
MQYRLELSKDAQKNLDKLGTVLRNKVFRVLDALADDPYVGKKLHGDLDGYWSVRAWPFRIIYKIRQKQLIILVLMIKHRKDVYR